MSSRSTCKRCFLWKNRFHGFTDETPESPDSNETEQASDDSESGAEISLCFHCGTLLDSVKSAHTALNQKFLIKPGAAGDTEANLFGISRSGEAVPLVLGSEIIDLTQNKNPWKFGQFELRRTGPYENPEMIWTIPTIVMLESETPIYGEFRANGQYRKSVFHPGDISLIPVGNVGRWASRSAHGLYQLRIKPSLVTNLALDFGLRAGVELPLLLPFYDEFVTATMHVLRDEAISGYSLGGVYGDMLISALAAHLLARYDMRAQNVSKAQGQLSALTLKIIIDFIEANFNQDISLTDLSSLAGMSAFHFSRLFKKSTELAPHQYILQVRLKHARELMKSGSSLKQAAHAVGFWDTSHLTRHFKRFYGVSPSKMFD